MVKVDGVTFTYDKHSKSVLKNVTFEIEDGQCVAVLGNNGAGKSTLLKCINRINETNSGSVMVDGKDVFQMKGRIRAQHIAYVPQHPEMTDMTVFDTVLLGRKPYITWDITNEDRQIAMQAIRQMGLCDYSMRIVSELSGGEVQKVMIARAIAQKPRLLLLDEPTSNLDPKNRHEVLKLIQDITHKERICTLIIIHDLNMAVRFCDRFLFLNESGVYSYGGSETVTQKTINDVYDIDTDIIYHEGMPFIIPK